MPGERVDGEEGGGKGRFSSRSLPPCHFQSSLFSGATSFRRSGFSFLTLLLLLLRRFSRV